MSEIAAPPNAESAPPRSFIGALEGQRSPGELSVVEGHGRGGGHNRRSLPGRAVRAVDRPDRPVQSRHQFPLGFAGSAELRRGWRSAVLARHGRPGARHLVGDPLRAPRLARDRVLRRPARRRDRHRARPDFGICRRLDRLGDHADRRRAADVSRNSHSPAAGWRRARAVEVVEPRPVGVRRTRRRDRPVVLGAICAHGARLHDGGEEPRLRAGRAADRAFACAHPLLAISCPT